MAENVVNIDDYRGCDLLATVDVYRQHDGRILLCPTFMDEEQIESVETISERFDLLAAWTISGVKSLRDQSADFREKEHGAEKP